MTHKTVPIEPTDDQIEAMRRQITEEMHCCNTSGYTAMYRAAVKAAPAQEAHDDVLEALDLSPEKYRTEGGAINAGKLRATILHPADYLPTDHWMRVQEAQPAPNDWQHLIPYGYAPGHYAGRCRDCKRVMNGIDKRAIRCRPCAEKLAAAATPAPQPAAPQAEDARMLDWLLTEVDSGRADRPARIARSIDRCPGRALFEFRVWGTAEEARAAIRAAMGGRP